MCVQSNSVCATHRVFLCVLLVLHDRNRIRRDHAHARLLRDDRRGGNMGSDNDALHAFLLCDALPSGNELHNGKRGGDALRALLGDMELDAFRHSYDGNHIHDLRTLILLNNKTFCSSLDLFVDAQGTPCLRIC